MCSFFEDFTMIHKYYFIINLPLLTALKYRIKWEKFIIGILWNPVQSVPFRNKLETRCKRRSRPL